MIFLNLSDEQFIWNIEELKILKHSTSLVRSSETGEVFIKKKVDENNVAVLKKLCNIRHRNLSSVIRVIDEGNQTFSYCEYVPGRSIQSYLDCEETFSEEKAINIVSQICDGLSVLHSNQIIHRDITAANIIVSADESIKIIDYGISRIPKENSSCDTTILGTAGYAAPEQFGFYQTDMRTDIYSVGILLNIMLTGKLPNEAEYDGRPGEIIKRATSIDADNRFNNVKALKSALHGNDPEAGPSFEKSSKHPGKIFSAFK